jgi:hypothetical protein
MRGRRSYHPERLFSDKIEYQTTCEELSEELSYIGLTQDGSEGNKVGVINSDLTRICTSLFDLIKFENSKPYKMIDYILQNDLSTYNPDRKKIEEIKKFVFNFIASKKEGKDNSKIPIFKSLYQQFKSDFSYSTLFKLVEKVNSAVTENFLVTEKINVSVKDKFTYQSYLYERMRNTEYTDTMLTDMYDHEIFKALIYVCNKNLKIAKGANKADSGFTSVMMDRVARMEEEAKGFRKKHADDIGTALGRNEKFHNYMRKRFSRLFRKLRMSDTHVDSGEKKQIFDKMLEYMYRYKEDDFDKVAKKINKFEKLCSYTGKDGERNISRMWIMFRFLIGLDELERGKYFTDELFWQLINNYIRENIKPEKALEEAPAVKTIKKGR